MRPGRLSFAATMTIPDIPYRQTPQRTLCLDLHLPEGVTNPPLVLFLPVSGLRSCYWKNPPLWIVERGFALASIDCRVCPEVTALDLIADCKAAVRWLRVHAKEYGYNGERIATWGHSAGGLLASTLATSGDAPELRGDGEHLDVSDAVQAACDECGVPHDLMFFARPDIKRDYAPVYENICLYVGGPLEENEELARRVSSPTYITAQCPPMLLIHGDKDDAVPVEEMVTFHEALQEKGVDSTLKILPGIGHAWPVEMTQDDITQFFRRTLGD